MKNYINKNNDDDNNKIHFYISFKIFKNKLLNRIDVSGEWMYRNKTTATTIKTTLEKK